MGCFYQRTASAKRQHVEEMNAVGNSGTEVHEGDGRWVKYIFIGLDFPTIKVLQQGVLRNRLRPGVDNAVRTHVTRRRPNVKTIVVPQYTFSTCIKTQTDRI